MNAFYNLDSGGLEWLEEPSPVPETARSTGATRIPLTAARPSAFPAWGKGIVGADSHEHDEVGLVYEDFDLRTRMQDKRMRKFAGMEECALPPVLVGPESFSNLVICGDPPSPSPEALECLGRDDRPCWPSNRCGPSRRPPGIFCGKRRSPPWWRETAPASSPGCFGKPSRGGGPHGAEIQRTSVLCGRGRGQARRILPGKGGGR